MFFVFIPTATFAQTLDVNSWIYKHYSSLSRDNLRLCNYNTRLLKLKRVRYLQHLPQ